MTSTEINKIPSTSDSDAITQKLAATNLNQNVGQNGSGMPPSSGSDDPMQVDNPVVFGLTQRIAAVETRIAKYDLRTATIAERVDILFDSDHLPQEKREEMKVSIASDNNFLRTMKDEANTELSQLREMLQKALLAELEMSKAKTAGNPVITEKGSAPREKNHSNIAAEKLPNFIMKSVPIGGSIENNEFTIRAFCRKFENVYMSNDVNIEKHWYHHLKAKVCTTDILESWFKRCISSEVDKNPSLGWKRAKEILFARFDLNNNLSIIMRNVALVSIKPSDEENLHEWIDRFTLNAKEAAQVDMNNNFLLGCIFLNSLGADKKFQEQLRGILVDYMKKSINGISSATDPTPIKDEEFVKFYSNFDNVADAIRGCYQVVKEQWSILRSSKSEKTKAESTGSSAGKHDSSKKRKSDSPHGTKNAKNGFANVDVNFEKIFDPKHKLSEDEKTLLSKLDKCWSCRTAENTVEHRSVCPVKQEYMKQRKTFSSNKVKFISHVTLKEVELPVSDTDVSSDDRNNKVDSDEYVDEFEVALNMDHDNWIMKQNDEEETENINKNKNIRCVTLYSTGKNFSVLKNNVVGEIDNPFKTDKADFSPVTPLIVNDHKSYGTVDSGAEVSIITKQFAEEHNIKFDKAEGYLVIADGSHIDRLQTLEPLRIDYDGVEKTVLHKFDIIDNDKVITTSKILIGVDLMKKLNIKMTGVAYKFKDTTKSIDDSVEDVAYEPNVSPYGSEREQKAFEIALKPYVEANMKLDKKSFCNIAESVLYLPTPPDYCVNIRQYPIAYQLQPKVMEVIEDWEKDGIIVKATPSAWNLPITVTIKKDHVSGVTVDKNSVTKDNIRVVLDTRALNRALPTINETQPLISDIFSTAMAGCVVFTTLDLKSAFNQFMVNPDDRIKTSFTAPNNLKYMYVGAPFGVSTISQLFSRVILTLFQGLPYVRSFIDDICIMSQSISAHFQHVKHVLSILTDANLRINFKKSHFAKAEVYLLGFSISAKGRQIDYRKLTNLQSMPRPVTSKQVQSVLGLFNYFRDFIPNAAELMAGMDALRSHDDKNKKKKQPFVWTDELEKDFNSLKEALTSKFVLSHANHDHPFIVATDASNYAIGCCLFQEYDKNDANGNSKKEIKHIAFFSRKLSGSEQRYSCTMRELLACVFALKQFHKFIWGVHFTLYTDHKALSYLHTQKHSNSMMIKWLDILLDYDFSIVYLKGIDNILPDALSRLYPPLDEEDKFTEVKVSRQLYSGNGNRAMSRNVNNLKKEAIVNKFVRQISTVRIVKKDAVTQDGVLDSDWEEIENDFFGQSEIHELKQLVANRSVFYIQNSQTIHADYMIAPESDRKEILEDAHNKVGHYGAEQMVKRIHNEGIHWPKLIDACIDMVRKCEECQKHNIQKKGYHPYRAIYSCLPGDHYAIDLGGPINTTSVLGNNYFLVIVCVTTRFCILRPLQDKKSDTVIRALVDVFSILGPPNSILQSDNGREFKHSLAAELSEALGFDHRFITPLHASANGISERYVQSVKRLLAKATNGLGTDWDMHLNAAQLALNNRISKRLNSSPFSLMFARQMREPFGFRKNHKNVAPEDRKPMSEEELLKRIDYMTDVVFPAINAKTKAQIELEKAKFDNSHRLVEYAPDSHVMVRLQTKNGQLAPSYVGPYTVVRKNQGNAYILRDHTGALMPRNYTSTELKLISHDEVIEIDDEGNEMKSYEIESILDHRGTHRTREYKVRWKNMSSDKDEWVPQAQFNANDMLREYWKKIGRPFTAKNTGIDTVSPTSRAVLKNNPPGSISKLLKDMPSIDELERESSSKAPPHRGRGRPKKSAGRTAVRNAKLKEPFQEKIVKNPRNRRPKRRSLGKPLN